MKEQASLYRRYNPTSLDDVIGNQLAKAKCDQLIELPPSKRPGFYLFTGPAGTGKSTLVHILFKEYGCSDIAVYNSRDCGKVDFVADFLNNNLYATSLMGANRAYIFEEAHNITAQAQEMFMEPMEKGLPQGVYVAFVTNTPEKIIGGKKALLTRPYRIETLPCTSVDIFKRLSVISDSEGFDVDEDEIGECAKLSNGCVRLAINNLERLSHLPKEMRKQELEIIRFESDSEVSDFSPDLKELATTVESGSWSRTAKLLKTLREKGEDPEGLRRGLLAWFSGVLLSDKPMCKNKHTRALVCLDALRDNYYNTGFAGLVGDLAHITNLKS